MGILQDRRDDKEKGREGEGKEEKGTENIDRESGDLEKVEKILR